MNYLQLTMDQTNPNQPTFSMRPFTEDRPIKKFGSPEAFRAMLVRCGCNEITIQTLFKELVHKGQMDEIQATSLPQDVRLELLTPDVGS